MGIEIVWDNPEQTVIRYIFDPVWTWDEFYSARDYAYSLIDAGGQRVGVIFDVPAGMKLPNNMLTNGRNTVARRHVNTSLIVIVVPNLYLRRLLEMILKLAGSKADIVEMAPTLDAARQRVHDHLQLR